MVRRWICPKEFFLCLKKISKCRSWQTSSSYWWYYYWQVYFGAYIAYLFWSTLHIRCIQIYYFSRYIQLGEDVWPLHRFLTPFVKSRRRFFIITEIRITREKFYWRKISCASSLSVRSCRRIFERGTSLIYDHFAFQLTTSRVHFILIWLSI